MGNCNSNYVKISFFNAKLAFLSSNLWIFPQMRYYSFISDWMDQWSNSSFMKLPLLSSVFAHKPVLRLVSVENANTHSQTVQLSAGWEDFLVVQKKMNEQWRCCQEKNQTNMTVKKLFNLIFTYESHFGLYYYEQA